MTLQWPSLRSMLKSCREKVQGVRQMICGPGTKTQISGATATEPPAKCVYVGFIQHCSPPGAAGFVLERPFEDTGAEDSLEPSHLVVALG